MKILHLSDLHYGYDGDATEQEKRKNCLESLLERIELYTKQDTIEYVIVTGDIAWKALQSDYEQAKEFINKISVSSKVPLNKFVFCPGNHDVNRRIADCLCVPKTFAEANKLYRVENIEMFSKPFEEYQKFLSSLDCKKPILRGDKFDNYLVGVLVYENINFIILNSEWAATGDEQKEMWIGNNFVETIQASQLLKKDNITLTLMHHPRESIHECERIPYSSTVNIFKKIDVLTDLLLCGHVHSNEIVVNPLSFSQGFSICIGATYVDNVYNNLCAIYDISEDKKLKIDCFYYRDSEWKLEKNEQVYCLDKSIVELQQHEEKIKIASDDIYNNLLNLDYAIENMLEDDFKKPGIIIWPVVPRKYVTHIHLALMGLC